MQDDAGAVVARGQVDRGHGAYRLTVEHNVRRTNAVADAQRIPRRLYVGVQVLLGGRAGAGAIARVVVREYVAVEARAEAVVEAAHLSEVDRIAVTEQDGVLGRGRALDEHAGDLVAALRARQEHLDLLELDRSVLPLSLFANTIYNIIVELSISYQMRYIYEPCRA